jgi:hypothetical protein
MKIKGTLFWILLDSTISGKEIILKGRYNLNITDKHEYQCLTYGFLYSNVPQFRLVVFIWFL